MTEEHRSSEDSEQHVVTDIFDDYNDTQRHVLVIETNKAKSKLFTIAIVLFISILIGLMIAKTPISYALFDLLVIPGVIFGLGFLAIKEPLVAVSIAAVIIIGLWVLQVVLLGGIALVSGWLVKAIVIYLLISGFLSAKEAHKIRREIGNRDL